MNVFQVLREFRVEGAGDPLAPGDEIAVDRLFKQGDMVDITGITKGRGYSGVVRRHGFSGFPSSHGTHEYFRHGGSIGNRSFPGRVFKNKRMAGQHGNDRVTTQNIEANSVDMTSTGGSITTLDIDANNFVQLLAADDISTGDITAFGQINLESSNGGISTQDLLSTDGDWQTLKSAISMFDEIARQPALKPFIARHIMPGANVKSDAEFETFIRNTVVTTHHPCGTCKMGSDGDETAVVDPTLKVRGAENLRVIDASVFPDIIGANINAATIMIAERAADLIRGRA